MKGKTMRLVNTTDFPNYFLRRMVSWCCKQLDFSVRKINGVVAVSRKRIGTRDAL